MLRVICKPEEHVDPLNMGVKKPPGLLHAKTGGRLANNVPTRGMPHWCSACPLPVCRLRLSNPPTMETESAVRASGFTLPHQAEKM